MRSFALALVALCTVACTGAPVGSVPSPQLACAADSGLCAAYTPGARSVRVLLVRPPSIVLLREAFVPPGDAVTAVHWSPDGLIVETVRERYALDTRTWTLAALTASTHHVTART